MSKTFSTDKARIKRKMNKSLLKMFNSGNRDRLNQIYAEMDNLEIDGHRYGNERKAKAKEKVISRRIMRRHDNNDIDIDE